MEKFVQLVVSGVLIGILVSAPMGPIGMLCIQRTLNKGRWPAFCTGIGAAISDLIYSILAGLGLAFITDFIDNNRSLLQLIGSIVLVFFGLYLFRKNPAGSLKKPTEHSNNYWLDFVTGFLFTFSNPLILFFIISLFAQFDFFGADHYHFYHYVMGYASIFGGAILWWYAITFFVNKVRAHFNVRSLWLINRIIGSLIIIMALCGIYLSLKVWIIH